MQEKDFNRTWIGTTYNCFNYLRFAKNIVNAASIPQALSNIGMYVATPIAKKIGDHSIVEMTQYGVIGVGLVLNPYVTAPVVAINYFGDKILEYKWNSMTPEQKQSAWGKEIHATLMVAKQEVALKAGQLADDYMRKKLDEPYANGSKGEASNEEEKSEKTKSTQTNQERNSNSEKANVYSAETNEQVDDLSRKGYKAQIPKTKNGQVVEGKYVTISSERAKQLLANGQTVEFKNSQVKGLDKKIWITRKNPYTQTNIRNTADNLVKQGYEPQVSKTDKYGNIKKGKYQKINPDEAKELLSKGQTVEYKGPNFLKSNRKIWLTELKKAAVTMRAIDESAHIIHVPYVSQDDDWMESDSSESESDNQSDLSPDFSDDEDIDRASEMSENEIAVDQQNEQEINYELQDEILSEEEVVIEIIPEIDDALVIPVELNSHARPENDLIIREEFDHLPKPLKQLCKKESRLSPQSVANALWLINGKVSAGEYRNIKQQFSFWATKHKPELVEQVDQEISCAYVMK